MKEPGSTAGLFALWCSSATYRQYEHAAKAFKIHLPEASPVNLVTDKETEGRVFVSTYPTMMGLIDDAKDGQRRFGVGHFDLVIIDEAHRSVYQKYGAIFDYFDSFLVGLTATPKNEIDRNTYSLFDLESGVPTDAYPLDEAVKDGFLVPPKAVSVPLKFQREGIKYDDLTDEEKEQWDALEWTEEGTIPDKVDAAAINKWLFAPERTKASRLQSKPVCLQCFKRQPARPLPPL
jgi:type I restriction enzyme, R subunit